MDVAPRALAAGTRTVARLLRAPGGIAGLSIAGALVAAAVLAGHLAPGDPLAPVAPPLSPPSRAHLMGTDDLGRDLLAGILHGLRTSLVVAFAVTAVSAPIGIGVGALAGYRRGVVDDALMRVAEMVQVVPRFFLAVVVIALFGPGLDRLVLLLGLTSWPWIARIVRAEVLSLRTRAFVEASRGLGAAPARTLVREVMPHALPPAVVIVSLNAAAVILLEAGLSFLGLGDPARVSLGYLASNAQRFLRVAWWMALFPGAAIALAVLAWNLLGDALNDALEPRSPR
ncbi:MAG TPA: ABC transporter permease [Candidatus Binatia bacterium]|nr:ABC transporter permease [Candidatus Binatia bacterium]